MSDSSSLKKVNHNVLFCFQFSVLLCCPSSTDSFKISSRRRKPPPTPPVNCNTVYLATWTACQHINTWSFIRLINTFGVYLQAQSHQHHSQQQTEHCGSTRTFAVVVLVVLVVAVFVLKKGYNSHTATKIVCFIRAKPKKYYQPISFSSQI